MEPSPGLGPQSRTEIGINAWLIGFSTIFYGLRLFVRVCMTKSPGFDDVLAGIAYVLLAISSGLDIHAVVLSTRVRLDAEPRDMVTKFFVSLVIQTLVYFWSVAIVRLAILAFLPRIVQDRTVSIASSIVAAIILAQTIAASIFRLNECTPISDVFKPPIDPGLHCIDPIIHNRMMIGHGIAGIVVDVILLLLPIWVIYTKMMWSRKTLQIILVLSVGVCAVAIAIIRIAVISNLNITAANMPLEMPTLGIWTNLEGHVGLWCGCFPSLQPILRVMPNGLRVLSTTNVNQRGGIRNTGINSEGYSESQRGIIPLEMGACKEATQDGDVHAA